MATEYTRYLQLPKHDLTDPFDITLINDAFERVDVAFTNLIRQAGLTQGFATSDGQRFVTADGQSMKLLIDLFAQ